MKHAHLEEGQSVEAGMPPAFISREQWIARCAKRLQEVANMESEPAIQTAEAQLENIGGDLSESPEQAADDEMSYWTAD